MADERTPSPTLLWLDIETTGLDPQKDAILEIACATADLARPFVTRGSDMSCVLRHTTRIENDFVREMHTKNGLIEECAASQHTLASAEEYLLGCVPELPKESRWILAGSSIHFDASFLRVWMPRLHARLSHRLYDVSAIKLFCQSLGMPKPPKAEAHRAMADVRESIKHARDCAAWLGRNP